MLLKARRNCPFSFANVSAGAWGGIAACTWDVVDEPVGFGLLQLVLRLDHSFAQRATRSNRSTDALGVEGSAQFFGEAGIVGKIDVAMAYLGACCGGGGGGRGGGT